MADELRWAELDDAWCRAEEAVEAAERRGLLATPVVAPEPGAVLDTAAAREGIVVVADRPGRRAPALLREALRARRAVLLVPELVNRRTR